MPRVDAEDHTGPPFERLREAGQIAEPERFGDVADGQAFVGQQHLRAVAAAVGRQHSERRAFRPQSPLQGALADVRHLRECSHARGGFVSYGVPVARRQAADPYATSLLLQRLSAHDLAHRSRRRVGLGQGRSSIESANMIRLVGAAVPRVPRKSPPGAEAGCLPSLLSTGSGSGGSRAR